MENKMSESKTWTWSSRNIHDGQRRKFLSQVFAAISICYFCICGGNLQGYTSSAIPSMKKALVSSVEIEEVIMTNEESNILGFQQARDILTESSSDGVSWTKPASSDVGQWLQLYWNDKQEFENLSHTQASWISGLSPLGAFVGSVIAPLPLGYFGPRGAILFLSGPIFLISWITTAFAPVPNIVYIARFLGGLAIGISTSLAPVYIMDTAPLHLRGPLGTLPQCFFVIGILISFILGSFFEWRETALICATLTVPGMFLLIFAPESPKWLLSQRRLKDAQKSYMWLNGRSEESLEEFLTLKNSVKQSKDLDTDLNQNQNQNKDLISEKMAEADADSAETIIYTNSSSTTPETTSVMSLLNYLYCEPGALKSTIVVFGLMLFQQITGINGVNFYTVTIFNEALGSRAVISGHTSSIIVASTLALATFSSIYLIEKLGRKILLTLSVTFIGLGAFSIGTFFYIKENADPEFVQNISWLPLVSLIAFVVAFSVGYGPVCWIIGAEILNSKIRPIISPIAVGFNWFCVFAVAKTYPDLVITLGTYGTFWLYGSLAILGLIFTLVCVPETKGKSETEIQKFFLT